MRVRIKKGDTVKILSGKDRGKTGVIERVSPKTRKVVVTGLNIVKKHMRPRKSAPHGGIIAIAAPLAMSRVMVVCPRCQKATRVQVSLDTEGRRHRMCQKCHETWN